MVCNFIASSSFKYTNKNNEKQHEQKAFFAHFYPNFSTGRLRGVYSSIIPPPWGSGKESKGLRAREENQRRVEKMERQREKKRKISVGNS